jgi:hypothetical protein
MANRDPENKITPDSRSTMIPRGKGKKTLMLDAIRDSVEGGEHEFLKQVVMIALGRDGSEESKPNTQLLTLVLQRIDPPLKSTLPLIEFDFNEKAKPAEQAAQVMKAASDGVIAPDIANIFVSSIASMLKIEEVTEIRKELDQIKEILGVNE